MKDCDICTLSCKQYVAQTDWGNIVYYVCRYHGVRKVGMYYLSCWNIRADGSFYAYGILWNEPGKNYY